jgi:hypothetical protein
MKGDEPTERRFIRSRFFWSIVMALLIGLAATFFPLLFSEVRDVSAFDVSNIAWRILIYAAMAWIGLLVAVMIYNWWWPARLFCHLLRWFFSWRILKRCLLTLVALFGLALLFRIEEDWRGKRAWEDYRREWEAKGEHFDFAYFIPPAVPDDQNFALTPIVTRCYSHVLDQKGHQLKSRDTESENTDVANRLAMNIYRQKLPTGTNMLLGSWQQAGLTDLQAWQEYYRAAFLTNEIPMWAPTWTNGELSTTKIEIEPLATNEFPTAPQPQTPAADVLLALSKYHPTIEELRQASRFSYSRFPLGYGASEPAAMIFPHYETIKSVVSVLRFRAVAELNNGQAEKALADVQLILYLANSIRNEPITWSLRVRMEILDNAIQPVWEGLARRQWSDEQLITLEDELAGLDAISDYSRSLRSDLAWQLKEIDYSLASRMTNSVTCMCGDPMFWPTLAVRLLPSGWFYLNKVTMARLCQAAVPTNAELSHRVLSPAITWRYAEIWRQVSISRMKPGNWIVGFLLPPLEREAKTCARAQASVDLARVACALERFRLANGSFPESLDALVPTYIQKLPHDVINGQPLHYRRTSDGSFLLYSVGWNEKDDGGKRDPIPATQYRSSLDQPSVTGDWVWCYPTN